MATINLSKRQTISLSKDTDTKKDGLRSITVGLGWEPVKSGFFSMFTGGNIDLDASILLLDANGNQIDFVSFQKEESSCGLIIHNGDNRTGHGKKGSDKETISVALEHLQKNTKYLAITVHSFTGQTFNDVEGCFCRILDAHNEEILRYDLQEKGSHKGVIVAVFEHKEDGWEFTAIGEPAPGRVLSDAVPAILANLPKGVISLTTINLRKDSPTIVLKKDSKIKSLGEIKVNLNWEQKKGGFLSSIFGNKDVDLDLAAYIKLKDGSKHIIQALGESFGSFERPPFLYLLDDDRTGQNTEGEWIKINGDNWDEIEEIIIFTFIYEGSANWEGMNARVAIYAPGNDTVETRLDESTNQGFCAIARLQNIGGDIKVERLNKYFDGHRQMDKAYGWGFRWTSGSK